MPAATFEGFLTAPSMGHYYNANIKGFSSDGPFDCRTLAFLDIRFSRTAMFEARPLTMPLVG